MSNFRKLVSMSAVAILGVTNLLTPLSYANAATEYDSLTMDDLKVKMLQFMMPNKDVYLYAHTEANKYFVTYSGTTKTSGEMGTGTFTYDQTGTLAPLNYAKTGYTFNEWNTQVNGGGTDYADQAKVWNWTAVQSGVVPIYAQWSANSYNIVYNLNDGTGTSTAVHTPTPPASLNYDQMGTVANPTRTGYAFSGWDISNMDSESHIVGGQASNATSATGVMGTGFKNLNSTNGQTVNFKAQWSRNTNTPYKVEHYTENLNGSGWTKVATDNLSGTTDTTVTPSVHTYTGFTKTANTPHSGNIDADGKKVFRYEYTRNSYTLTLNAGRGVSLAEGVGTVNTTGGSTSTTTTISFRYDEPVTLSYILKPGYESGTWTGSDANTSSFDMPASNIIRTASATPTVYTITYNTRSGTVASPNPTSYTVEDDDFRLNPPTRVHSQFEGWTGGVISGTQLSGPTTSVKIEEGSIGNRSYTATWSCLSGYHLNGDATECIPNADTSYTVRHFKQDLNGTYEVVPEYTYQTGTTDDHVNPKPKTYEGFEVVTPINTEPTIHGSGDTVVDIQYRRLAYSGTINNPSGVLATSITSTATGAHPTGTAGTYKYGDTVTINATMKTGYTFNGWTVQTTGGTPVTVSNASSLTNATFTMPASAVTITPNVTKVTYDITYELNSGSVTTVNPTSYDVETATFTLHNPTRDHSTFVGWSGTDIVGTSTSVTIAKGSVGDRSYEAIWRCHTGYHAVGNSCVANEYHGSVEFNDGTGHGAAETIDFTYDQYTNLPNPSQSGYDFAGWDIIGMSGDVEHYIGTLPVTGSSVSGTMATGFKNLSTDQGATDIVFRAKWTPRDDTEYVVYHYYKELGETTYELLKTDELTGTTDTELVFNPGLLKNKTGFTYSAGYLTGGPTRPTTGAVTTGNINKDGSTKIYLYYTRNKWNVYLSGDAHVATLSGAGQYEYGADVTVDMTAKTGYHFTHWEKKDSF